MLNSDYLHLGAFQTPADLLMVLTMVCVPMMHQKEKERPNRRVLINYRSQLSCWVAGTRVRDRWRLPEPAQPRGRESIQLEVESLHVRKMTGNYGWTRRRKQTWSFRLCVGESRGERALHVYRHCLSLLSWIPSPGDNVVRPTIQEYFVPSKFSA